jgi:NitT/TauT family transport system substrate-binding protein
MSRVLSARRNVQALGALIALSLVAAACGDDDAPTAAGGDDEVVELEMVVFAPPSLGAFLPPVIEDQEFDLQHGIDLQFVERPPGSYNAEYGAGQYELGGSASLMSEAVRVSEGVDVVYLFNVFDYWATVVSTNDEIGELSDLGDGHLLAGATSSTSWAMFEWFALQEGVDLDAVTINDADTGGLGTLAQTGRADAVQMWEPGVSNLMAQGPDNVTEVGIPLERWEEQYGFTDIPYLGVGAHRSWIEEHEDLIPDLQAVYEDAAEWTLANPDEAAEIIAGSMDNGDPAPLAELLADNERLGLNVQPASELSDGIRAVFDAGVEIGYFAEPPSDDVIYEGN